MILIQFPKSSKQLEKGEQTCSSDLYEYPGPQSQILHCTTNKIIQASFITSSQGREPQDWATTVDWTQLFKDILACPDTLWYLKLVFEAIERSHLHGLEAVNFSNQQIYAVNFWWMD